MKIITSPAKLMNTENSTHLLRSTTPKFIDDSEFIQSSFKAQISEISFGTDGNFTKTRR